MPEYRRLFKVWRDLTGRPSLYWLHRKLFWLSLKGMGISSSEDAVASGEAGFLDAWAGTMPGAAPVVFDVGAHQGSWARLVLERVPGARVHCFEPHPDSFRRLQAALQGRVTFNRCALDRAVGKARFYDYAARTPGGSGSEHASLHPGVFGQVHHAATRSWGVRLDTVDAYCRAAGIARVDLLKVDTEGNELRVLQGAKGLLGRRAIGAIQFEFNGMSAVGRSFMADFEALLKGYTLHRLLRHGLLPLAGMPLELKELFAFQNIVALPPGTPRAGH